MSSPLSAGMKMAMLLFGATVLGIGLLVDTDFRLGIYIGYSIGLLATVLHLIITRFAQQQQGERFKLLFYAGLFLRFFVVLALFAAVLLLSEIDEISFTVSFLISYLFHSVNEVLFLSKNHH
ncbi:MAG: hypothetical protein ACNA78_04750 [Balneolaceae bacterium]